MRKVYLAGPDVFLADAVAAGARKKLLCRSHGFEGLYPLDNAVDGSPAIYAANMSLIRAADFGIFNLTPFRGVSADVGSVFEFGVFVGMGKPVFAYSNVAEDLLARARREVGPSFDAATKSWHDGFGMAIEDFGNADNLMIDEALAAQGRRLHRAAVAEAERFTDLGGFTACLHEAHAVFAAVS